MYKTSPGQQHPKEKNICKNVGLFQWPSGLPPLCVLWHSCHHRPFLSQRQQKAGQSSPNLHPRDFSRLLAFKYFFHRYKTVFPKEKATALFCYDFWNDFADMKRRKNTQTQFCSPRSQGFMVWLLTWSLLSNMVKSFPSPSSRDLSFFQEEVQPGHPSGDDGWCQQWWGGQSRASNTSPAACWVHQKVPEFTSTVLKGKNITH